MKKVKEDIGGNQPLYFDNIDDKVEVKNGQLQNYKARDDLSCNNLNAKPIIRDKYLKMIRESAEYSINDAMMPAHIVK